MPEFRQKKFKLILKHSFFWFIGTFDLFPCTGAPMIASQPHFYGADPALLRHFESGISPNKEEHAIFMHFEMVRHLSIIERNSYSFRVKLNEMILGDWNTFEGWQTFTIQSRNGSHRRSIIYGERA